MAPQRSSKAFCLTDLSVLDRSMEVILVLRALLLPGLGFLSTEVCIGRFPGHVAF